MSAPRLWRLLPPLLALVLGLLPLDAFAEAVECPNCWRMVDEGPCRCPHCNAELPGRECPPEPEHEPQPAPEPEPRPEARHERQRPEAGAEDARPRGRDGEARRAPPRRDERRRPSKRRVRRVERRPSKAGAPRDGSARRPRHAGKRRPAPRRQPRDQDAPRAHHRREARDHDAARGLDDGPPRRRVRRRPPAEEVDDETDEDLEPDIEETEGGEGARGGERPRWLGPSFLVGYRYFGLIDWAGEGHTHALSVEGFPIARYLPWLRVGLGFDTGFRIAEAHTDWTLRGFLSVGLQYPWRLTPYLSFNLGGGMAYRKRFGQGLTDGLLGMGIDAGATLAVTRTFVMDLGLGWMYTSFDDLDYHSFTIRVSLGW